MYLFGYTIQNNEGKTLRSDMIKLLLLLALLFNITHASIIAMEDDCPHESSHVYIMEQTQASECGDLCDMHHLFHFMAIINTSHIHFYALLQQEKLTQSISHYTPPFQKTTFKPPIA